MKVNASALQSVLTISIVIILIMAVLLMFSITLRMNFQKYHRNDVLNKNAVSAMNLLLSGNDLNIESIKDLYGNYSDSVFLNKKAWGIYEVYIAQAFTMTDTVKKEAIIGNLLLKEEKFALYLADQHRPLSISGETKIIGNVLIPEAGIRKAYIEGQAFVGDKTVNGIIEFSSSELPLLNKMILNRIDSLLMDSVVVDHNARGESFFPDSITNDFDKPVYYIYETDSLVLENIYLKGNIIVVCKEAVQIDSTAVLIDIQLYAPSVIVKEGFKGSIQIFSRDSIRVDRNVILEYPSVLGLVTAKKDAHQYDYNPSISIYENSLIKGIVFSSVGDKDNPFPIIRINRKASIRGQLFSSGLLQLQGAVIGSTITTGFTLKTPSTLYENFVLNGVMDFNELSEYYLGSKLINKNKVSGILKWL